MSRIPDGRRTATPPVVARLADLAPEYATRVTVADKKDGHGLVRALHPTTGKRHARAVEDFPFVDLCTEGTGRGPGGLLWALIVDMDHDDSLLRIFAADVPRPSWIIEKGRNGHVQAGWIIEAVALGPNARQAPQDYAEDVRAALTAECDGDPQFRNRRAWNPAWTSWQTEGRVIWGPKQPRTLGALKAEMVKRGTWPSPEARRTVRTRQGAATARTLITEAAASMQVREGERNVFVFDMARTRKTGPVAEAAAAANALCTPPLPAAEVAGIVRSIERWEARTGARSGGTGCGSTAWSTIQAARGRVGGSRGTQAQRIQRVNAAGRATAARSRQALARAKEARRQARRGWTTARIAAHFGVDRRTVRRWLNTRPRKTIQRADISGASGYPRAPYRPSLPPQHPSPHLPHTPVASPRPQPRSTAPPPVPSPS